MPLKIYVDFALGPKPLELLKKGVGAHQLLLPSKPAASVLTKPEVDPSFYQADIAFGQPDLEAIDKAESLKWIQINTSGITAFDTPGFREKMEKRSIPVCNSANVYNEACADHLFAFMLAQSRRLVEGLASQAANGSPEWLKLRSDSGSLKGQSALILGYGAIGSRLVELLAPFRMNVTAYRRKARGDEPIPVVGPNELSSELAKADHVINILPDSEATKDFFDAARFSDCKKGSVFYNIGRGTTVDQKALEVALTSGQLKEAWLDVTNPEPLPAEHPLRALANCYITPHIAGGYLGESEGCVQHFLDNLKRFENGETLVNRVM
ncbi:D-2-hydroxyacid dehydrogenase [Pelagicoccus albus]|uniref:D-2-hydroxyacid dehydrogenase n=1 Tax=Pelagicoccus albus TaxID=415222 RepID=A0A7X1B3K8_9BACT|nr:D-2-hydroxyacid dehydrogenase [Pelagicoccus albus]MBC2604962.1 D-2-hydroxyacid dehydrogenase [Pelagicoccus albus]